MDSLNEPADLEAAAEKVRALRRSFLVEDIGEDGSDIFTQEHFLLALAALDQAAAHLRLAQYHQARSNAERF